MPSPFLHGFLPGFFLAARGRRRALALGVASFALAVSAARAADAVEIQYGISLASLPIGTAQLAATFNRDAYKLDVKARMTGLAGMLTSGKGAGAATGSAAGGKVSPATYALVSGGGDNTVSVRMALNAGSVANLDIEPPLEPRPDRVPLQESHTRNVVDPISALLMSPPPGNGLLDRANCERTIPVFDGAGRFDVKLSYSATRKVSVPGYSGDVLVCSARYTPIAGHRTSRKATQFMAENKEMEVWLAPFEGPRALLPYKISVRTMIGTAVIEATKLTASKN